MKKQMIGLLALASFFLGGSQVYANTDVTIRCLDQNTHKTIQVVRERLVGDGVSYIKKQDLPGYQADKRQILAKVNGNKQKADVVFYYVKTIAVKVRSVAAGNQVLAEKLLKGGQGSSTIYQAPTSLANYQLDGKDNVTIKFDKDKVVTVNYKEVAEQAQAATPTQNAPEVQNAEVVGQPAQVASVDEPASPQAVVNAPQAVAQEPQATPQVPEQSQPASPAPTPTPAPQAPASPYALDITAPYTGYVPQSGFGLWMNNYVVAHNPGSGAAFLSLGIGSLARINGQVYRVSEIYRIWGPPETYPESTAQLRYKDWYDTSIDRASVIFDGRMTLQTCADNGLKSVWIYKLNPA